MAPGDRKCQELRGQGTDVRAEVVIGLGFALLVAPVGLAGSEDDPEISDELGDVDWGLPYSIGPASPFPAAASLDIDRSWFHDETPTDIQLTMKVADLANVTDFETNGGFGRWGTRFELSNYVPDTRDNWWNYTWIITVDVNNGPTGWHSYVATPDANGTRGEERTASLLRDIEDDRFVLTIPRTSLGSPQAGDRMFDLRSLHDGDMGLAPYATDHQDQSSSPRAEYVFQMDSVPEGVGGSRENATQESVGGNATSKPVPSAPVATLTALGLAFALRRQSSK